jgi:transcriptional regulator with XRE-family HTH domain
MISVENFTKRRLELGLSESELAKRAGVSQSLIDQIEAGKNKTSKKIFQLAKAMKVPVSFLDPDIDIDEHIPSEQIATGQVRSTPAEEDPTLAPMYGVVEGGEGDLITAWEVIEYVARTEPLTGVRNGYGMYVVGSSMDPAYVPGNRVLVNPNIPARPGDDVLLFQAEIGRETPGLIKRLVKATPKTWTVEQFNPRKTFDLPRAIWKHCHVVVTRFPR